MRTDFYQTVAALQSRFGSKCVPVQLPIGAHSSFEGIIDLLTMKSYTGTAAKEGEIPESLQERVSSFREKLVEAVAEIDDTLLEKYLGGEELDLDELVEGLRKGVVVMRVSASMVIGIV